MSDNAYRMRLAHRQDAMPLIEDITRHPSRRFEFEVEVGAQEDLIRAQLIGIDELRRLAGVMIDPPPRALIQTLGHSNIQLRFRG